MLEHTLKVRDRTPPPQPQPNPNPEALGRYVGDLATFLKAYAFPHPDTERPGKGLYPGSCRSVNSEQDSRLCACFCSAGSLTFSGHGGGSGRGPDQRLLCGRLMVRLAKSRDLLVSTSWKTMKQSHPQWGIQERDRYHRRPGGSDFLTDGTHLTNALRGKALFLE